LTNHQRFRLWKPDLLSSSDLLTIAESGSCLTYTWLNGDM